LSNTGAVAKFEQIAIKCCQIVAIALSVVEFEQTAISTICDWQHCVFHYL